MPCLTGIELAHEIAASWPHLPVLLMTGYAEQMEAAEDLTAIIEGVVEKPFSIAELRREVARILAERAAQKGNTADAPTAPHIRRCA